MPRIVDPALIKKGSGMANQDSIDANAFVDEVVESNGQGLEAHVNDPHAHPASAISTTTSQGVYDGNNVQANLDELSGLVPPRPPTIGNYSTVLAFSGLSDWGHLKLHDAGFVARGEVTSPVAAQPNNDFFVYPEFWTAPFVAGNAYDTLLSLSPNPRGDVFSIPGNDPSTDPVFNIDPAGTADPTYTGGGLGQSHQGGFMAPGPFGPFGPVIETMRVMPTTGGAFTPIVVSGAVYPADRGVVALIHWPDQGTVIDFLAQPLEDRVIAALVCGQGINDECDGEPGGIFTEGTPDVFSFPGRATGQWDLSEIHAGINRISGVPLPSGPLPGAGQVRLGTDPLAGPVIPGGIPILGGTTISTGGGNDNNYFRYRLPYLENYSDTDGIQYTPDPEKLRYFDKPVVSDTPATNLTQAGTYTDFPKDYWHFQVARYRHRFNFLVNVPLPPDPQFQGNYLIMHFRRERDFEVFARDGIMPDDVFNPYALWGVGLVTYVPEESTDNLIDATTFLPPVLATSLGYHSLRGGIIEDPINPPVAFGLGYTFTNELDQVHVVSGVRYFTPNGTGVGTNFAIDTLTFSAGALFYSSFRLGNQGGPFEVTPGLTHTNPVILYLGGHTAGSNIINGLGAGYTGTAFYQRVDFGYEDLGSISGPFSLLSAPTPISTADVLLVGGDVPITFSGDTAPCHFWEDSRIRFFARKPLDQEDSTTYATEFLVPRPGGDQILFHTTDHSPGTIGVGEYGNFTLGGFFNPPRAGLETPRKDVQELFLDEIYRVADSSLPTLDPSYVPALLIGNLVGPGLPFPPAPIELPVRIASTSPFTFGFGSYTQNNFHLFPLTVFTLSTEAQVAGLPDRNPPVTDGVANPCPFGGRLIYPVTDYTVGFRPSFVAGDITTPQPDYSVIASAERVYLRIFDAAWSLDPTPEPTVVGQPFLTLRIDGLELTDFAYTPGPGPGNANIGIEIKIPGLTTWMDLGRPDGSGPSKQDPLTDGAGCKVINPVTTFNGRDAVTGTVYAQVQVNVGPAANVFANTGLTPAPIGVAPVIVRVRMKSGSTLDFTQGGSGSTSDTPRGLVGITLLRTSNLAGPSTFGPPTPYP